MCLSIPVKITEIKKNSAMVKNGRHNLEINTSLIKRPQIGDWIIIHANLAIKKISKKEAYEIQGYLS
ncbi:MAG: HypC/HybG/HupF family hydrogenase formation chaperone, partial [Patescibacteria group bacterium]|nr:HypC/HybG/HupF family hydrogenase formation chaperone [Patescibacteria group bacterium]